MRAFVIGCAFVALAALPVSGALAAQQDQRPAGRILASADQSAKRAATTQSSCDRWAQDVAPHNPGTAQALAAKCKTRRAAKQSAVRN